MIRTVVSGTPILTGSSILNLVGAYITNRIIFIFLMLHGRFLCLRMQYLFLWNDPIEYETAGYYEIISFYHVNTYIPQPFGAK